MRSRPALLVLVAVAAGLLGCSGATGSSSPPSSGAVSVPPTGSTVAWVPAAGGRQLLDGFQEVTVHVRQADGSVRDVCLLLADDDAQRERGLMFVTDPALGGHGGMLFRFERDDQGAFWMKNTILPLSIAYVGVDGKTVSTADMAPCPAGTVSCPTYAAAGPYRYAVEVPEGRLADIGLTTGATLEVGDRSCL